ncbi:transposase [Clostridium sp. MCC353]|uniref:transposase n=1 Tax=Clostridium sp. MCC353 TaxID=2592646 RepID=UPI0031FF2F3C
MHISTPKTERIFENILCNSYAFGIIKLWKKIYELSEKTKLTYGRKYVYSLQYHIIWCTKYRKNVLMDGLDL